jgi:phosphopantetheinyl transferase (holo-ACP synthase)
LPAPGALLDCAGQLMGWWVMERERVDRLAMPVHIERVRFFGDAPAPDARVACRVRVRELDDRAVTADLELAIGDRVWCCLDGWEDRRFDSDDAVWKVLRHPEHHALAEPTADGFVWCREHWRTAASRELMMRRYLGERERAAYEATGPRARRGWLLGRIALKDAVRLDAWRAGAAPIYPVEIELDHAEGGWPIVVGRDVHASVAHKDDVAVALIARDGVPGIDVERVEPRAPAMIAVAFTDEELALGAGRDLDEWLTRLWAAKEALAKARRTGLGDPRRLAATAAEGDRITVDGVAIETRRDGDHVVAWTILR